MMDDNLYTVTFTTLNITSLLDMLRYDGATVVTWDNVGDDSRFRLARYQVTLRGRCTTDRWLSFGLVPKQLP